MKRKKTPKKPSTRLPDGRIAPSAIDEYFLKPLQEMTTEQFLAEVAEANPQLDPHLDLGIPKAKTA